MEVFGLFSRTVRKVKFQEARLASQRRFGMVFNRASLVRHIVLIYMTPSLWALAPPLYPDYVRHAAAILRVTGA